MKAKAVHIHTATKPSNPKGNVLLTKYYGEETKGAQAHIKQK